jgi:hypothetical protein
MYTENIDVIPVCKYNFVIELDFITDLEII